MSSHGEIHGKTHSHTQYSPPQRDEHPRKAGFPWWGTHWRPGVHYHPGAGRPRTRWSRYVTWTTSSAWHRSLKAGELRTQHNQLTIRVQLRLRIRSLQGSSGEGGQRMEEKTRQLKQYSQLESRVQLRLRIRNLREYSREWGQHTEEKTRQSEQQGNQREFGNRIRQVLEMGSLCHRFQGDECCQRHRWILRGGFHQEPDGRRRVKTKCKNHQRRTQSGRHFCPVHRELWELRKGRVIIEKNGERIYKYTYLPIEITESELDHA